VSQTPEFHTETGKVVEAYRKRAIVELEAPADAGKRPECGRCGLCASLGGGRAGTLPELRAAAPPDLRLAPGDRVEVRLRLASPGKAAVLLLGLPLAAFAGGVLGAWWLWKSEAAMMACGFGALAAAYLALYLVDRARGARAEITRKL